MSKHKKKDKVEESAKGKGKKSGKKKEAAKALETAADLAAQSPAAPVAETAVEVEAPAPVAKAKKAAPAKRKAPARKPAAEVVEIEISHAEIGLRAYFIAEHRYKNHLPGDEHGDWVEAERQLKAEAKKAKKK